jgi:uncharacterized membrane protein YgcG
LVPKLPSVTVSETSLPVEEVPLLSDLLLDDTEPPNLSKLVEAAVLVMSVVMLVRVMPSSLFGNAGGSGGGASEGGGGGKALRRD